MWILLLIGCLIPFVYLDFMMPKLDRILAEGFRPAEKEEVRPAAVVLGETELAESVIELLKSNDIEVFSLSEPFLLEREKSFCCMLALSENDADNMVLCKIGKMVYGIDKIVSLCNDRRNESMFIKESIRFLPAEELTPQMLYESVLPRTETK